MKVFISYKQSGVDNQELTNNLWKIRDYLDDLGHQSFIYYFDSDFREKTHKEIIEISRDEIIKCDFVLTFIHHDKKSEWMLLELWMAYALDKPIITLLNSDFQDDYYLTYWVSNNTIIFDSFEEIQELLNKYLPKNND